MLKQTEKTIKWFTTTEDEILEKLVNSNHVFRKLVKLIDFDKLTEPLKNLYSHTGKKGLPVEQGFKALLVQFWEDYSDREMEKVLQENVAVKWFCNFKLTEPTPDHSYFGKLRSRIGAENIAKIFNKINDKLKKQGLFGDVFKFIDASSIITKTALWEERDKAIKNGEETFNNKNLEKYVTDKDARWGAKSKNKYWFGFKRNVMVDMRYGLIDKVIVSAANILDYKMVKELDPKNCMVFMDKGYDYKEVEEVLKNNQCHGGIIKKNNKRNKNFDLDKWISKTRMPYEYVFSKVSKRAKYKGKAKVGIQCYLESICHNLKKAIKILPTEIGV